MCGADVKPLMKDRPENQPAVGQNKGWSSAGFVLHGYTRSVVSQKCSYGRGGLLIRGCMFYRDTQRVLFQKSALKEGVVF